VEADIDDRGVLEVGELLTVGVCEEEEVWTTALGDGHGAVDWLWWC